jgi:hypothetical protein
VIDDDPRVRELGADRLAVRLVGIDRDHLDRPPRVRRERAQVALDAAAAAPVEHLHHAPAIQIGDHRREFAAAAVMGLVQREPPRGPGRRLQLVAAVAERARSCARSASVTHAGCGSTGSRTACRPTGRPTSAPSPPPTTSNSSRSDLRQLPQPHRGALPPDHRVRRQQRRLPRLGRLRARPRPPHPAPQQTRPRPPHRRPRGQAHDRRLADGVPGATFEKAHWAATVVLHPLSSQLRDLNHREASRGQRMSLSAPQPRKVSKTRKVTHLGVGFVGPGSDPRWIW